MLLKEYGKNEHTLPFASMLVRKLVVLRYQTACFLQNNQWIHYIFLLKLNMIVKFKNKLAGQ
jgi:hypothetical protein